ILSATNNFAEENKVEIAYFGNQYYGQLLWSGELIKIFAQRYNKEWSQRDQEFWMEISMLSSLKHKNLVSLVGLEICVGVSHALSYIDYDEHHDFSVIHRNIDSLNILLNDKLEPKLSELRLSMKIEASQRHRSFHVDKVWDMEGQGYTDPTYEKTKSAHHKSDMYSFVVGKL
ncbi:kinase-like domain, phloem protein 2-like protein, partial [Tanacetum coccineum]